MADKVKDIVYTDETKETVDVINLLLLGWILLGLVVYILGNVIATQLKKRKAKDFVESSESGAGPEAAVKQTSEFVAAAAAKSEEPAENLRYDLVEAPVCSGDDSDVVDWLNNVFTWIYNQRVVSPVLDSWLSALNARTRLLSTEHGILVDFQNVIHSNQAPSVTDVFESLGGKGIVFVSFELEVLKLVFEVKVTQVKDKDTNIFTFLLHLSRLAGQLNVTCAPEESAFVAQFAERPQVQLDVETEPSSPVPEDALQKLVCEIASEAFSSSEIELRFSPSSECPKFIPSELSITDEKFELAETEKEEKLLVKVVQANSIGGTEGSMKPYCVIEMDEPPQHFETLPAEDGLNPVWEESFVFSCKSLSAELLFELYDKGKPEKENFLGLCIVSVEELIRNPSQKQVIPLQPRPLEKDNVTGTLVAEFSFLDWTASAAESIQSGPQVPAVKSEVDIQPGKTVETNSRVTAGGTIITTTTIKRTAEGTSDSEKPPETTAGTNPNQNKAFRTISESRKQFLELLIETDPQDEHSFINIGQNGEAVKCSDVTVEASTVHGGACDSLPHEVASHCNGVAYACGNSCDQVKSDGSAELAENSCSAGEHEGNVHEKKCLPLINVNGNVHDLPEDCTKFDSYLPPIDEETVEVSAAPSLAVEQNNKNDAEDLTNTALKELEKQAKPTPSKSTLIIHSVQRMDTSGSESLEASPASHPSGDSRSSHQLSLPPSPSIHRNGVDRSRPKEKKSLIGNLRKKLSFRKTRSKSMELRPEASSDSGADEHGAPKERAKSSLAIRETSSLKSGRRFLAIPGSTRSSFSEASGVSAASSRTYINENSTLVIEINENGIVKRYLIPSSMIHRSKWKKKGVKLHLYNDHVFVAKHLTGSTMCQVCKKHLTRRPGKQGYECRDCNIQCHKSCHVKVAEYCPNSSVTSMEVEYIHDPKVTKPKSA